MIRSDNREEDGTKLFFYILTNPSFMKIIII